MSFSFGANTSKPAFSFGNTSTATSAPSGFAGFGGAATTSTSVFGAPTSTVAPFGSIGAAVTTTTPSLFGAGGLGAATSKPSIGFGNTSFGSSFGNTFGSTAPAFGSTAPAFGSTAPAFGSTAPAFGSTAPAFGSTAPAFGTNTFGAGSTFGSAFGAKPATTGLNFGGALGTNTLGLQTQQQQQQQQQQQGPASAHEALVAAVFNCNVFGDERDQVLAKWNLIQAQWGTGQAYYSRNAPPLELNEQNPLCRFKAVGYSRLGGKEDKEGHVSMVFNKQEADIKNNQQQMITSLAGVLGNKPNLAVNIDSIQAVAGNKTQMVIYVVDKNALGSRVAASELCAFLQNAKAALSAGGCVSLAPATRPDKHALDLYLNTPPPGLDMRMWKQAQTDNPDSENYIPVPIIGFSEIKFRSQCQSQQASLQAGFLKKASEQLNELRSKRAAAAAKLSQLAAKHHALKHTLLQVISRQEVIGRVGAALNPEEEASRARLQELSSQLAAPPLNNGRLNELLCAVRLQRSASAGGSHERYHLDPGAQEDVKQFLALQQRGMAHLLDTARKDLAALNVIADGMSRLVHA